MSTLPQTTAPAAEWNFEQVYTTYHKPISSYLYSFVGSPEQAEDMAQETFFKAFRALEASSQPLNMAAWLYRIAHNVAVDELRRRKLIHWHSLEAQKYEAGEIAGAEADEPEAPYTGTTGAVWATLTQMDEKYRQALISYYILGLDAAEIAQTLQVKPSGVKMFLTRARRTFRIQYRAEQEEEQG